MAVVSCGIMTTGEEKKIVGATRVTETQTIRVPVFLSPTEPLQKKQKGPTLENTLADRHYIK